MEELLKAQNIIGCGIFIHALFIFLGSLGKGNTQIQDVLNLSIQNISVTKMKLIEVCNAEYKCGDREQTDDSEEESFTIGRLISNAHSVTPILRFLGWFPFVLYLVAFFLAYIPDSEYSDSIKQGVPSIALVGFAAGIQASYLLVKLVTGLPEVLMMLHPKYKEKTNWLFIWFDLYPIWKR